ncbi:MAG: A/G-specific adenine glycosylase, partial [Rhodospirillaceae bacterium]|nr:A/G-specific adenine glycosylase [Rhodospirillaceae bacterium]
MTIPPHAAPPDRSALLAWYDRHCRRLPWRAEPGRRADPYHVWISEIMLQQTTVAAVADYFVRFTQHWPTVADLAAAPLDDVLTQWAGLGYYARARNLHRCAQAVAARGGRFPETPQELQELPGIGPYTAAAVAAIAFDHPVVPVDGNVERVTARMFAIATPLPTAKPALRAAATAFAGNERPGDMAQALMDLGATVCTPRQPRCVLCPWQEACAARRLGIAAELPAKAAKPEKPLRRGTAYWLTDRDGAVWLRRRPERGLLGGMVE